MSTRAGTSVVTFWAKQIAGMPRLDDRRAAIIDFRKKYDHSSTELLKQEILKHFPGRHGNNAGNQAGSR